ncbi:hypothetical protein [Methanoregula sp.]|jgi:cytochrome c biogenesis protein CcdA|uniref:hypothetical protein n=1 Tax=Methanoregula sp. TaxID=2052170 RepID=UPI003C16A60A
MGSPPPAAFILGMPFGIIIHPCNTATVTVLIALASTASGVIGGLGAFLVCGLRINVP